MPSNRFIPTLEGLPAKAALDLRNVIQQFFELNDQVQAQNNLISTQGGKIATAVQQPQSQPFSLGPVAANITPFLDPQIAKAVSVTSLPNVNNDILSQDGTLISLSGVIYRFDGLSTNPGSWKTLGAVAVVLRDTHANKVNYPAANYPTGTLFYETDRTVFYQNSGAAWVYSVGTCHDTLANIPIDLAGATDNNFIFEVTDYGHTLRWLGAQWFWGPGDLGSGYYQLFEAAPAVSWANAWALCDGSTVARLNQNGTTTNVTLDDVTTAAYLKGGTVSAAVAAASGKTSSDSAGTPSGTNNSPNTGNDTDAGFKAMADATGTLVAVNPHVHTTTAPTFTGDPLAGHDHGPNTLELRNKQAKLYYRR